jgi:hypothetical protein
LWAKFNWLTTEASDGLLRTRKWNFEFLSSWATISSSRRILFHRLGYYIQLQALYIVDIEPHGLPLGYVIIGRLLAVLFSAVYLKIYVKQKEREGKGGEMGRACSICGAARAASYTEPIIRWLLAHYSLLYYRPSFTGHNSVEEGFYGNNELQRNCTSSTVQWIPWRTFPATFVSADSV